MPPIRTSQRIPSFQTPTPTIITAHFLRQIEANHVRTPGQGRPVPLHFNAVTQSLSEWGWPIDVGTDKRVPPSELEDFRRTHRFKAPSCLCALLEGTKYTESRIGIVETVTNDEFRNQSVLNGEYVATCAKQRCGYFLCLERFYPLIFLKIQVCYPRKISLAPQELATITDIDKSLRGGDGLFQLMTDIVVRGSGRHLEKVHPDSAKKAKDALIDELVAGVSEERFWTTFVQCFVCKVVTLRKYFAINHVCGGKKHAGHPYPRPEVPESPSPSVAGYQVPSSPTSTELNDFDYEPPTDAAYDVFGDIEYMPMSPVGGAPGRGGAEVDAPEDINEESSSDSDLPTILEVMQAVPRRGVIVSGSISTASHVA